MQLITIIVVAYNSERYIIETLESAKNQTYKNIELIITDDSSTDDTITICRKWLSINAKYFKRSEIITSKINTGIPANCNRGVNASYGEWVKLIAGDDVLTRSCVSDLLYFTSSNNKIDVVITQQQSFKDNLSPKNYLEVTPNRINHTFYNIKSTPSEQISFIIKKEVYIPGPTTFIKREALKSVGLYNEKYKLVEDLPLFYKFLKNNIKVYFLPKVTIYYRIHSSSISNRIDPILVPKVCLYLNDFYIDEVSKDVTLIENIDIHWIALLEKSIYKLGNKGPVLNLFYKFFLKIKPLNFRNFILKK